MTTQSIESVAFTVTEEQVDQILSNRKRILDLESMIASGQGSNNSVLISELFDLQNQNIKILESELRENVEIGVFEGGEFGVDGLELSITPIDLQHFYRKIIETRELFI